MNTSKLAIVVFSRMSSSRLPGKALMDFAGRPLLAHILERARPLGLPLIVATSDKSEDASVAELAQQHGAQVFRGPLDDVLQRAVDCAKAHGLDAFARLCGDRPYFPVDQMRGGLAQMHSALRAHQPLDLVTNHLPDSPPPGLSTEVVRVSALERVLAAGPNARHREHLTSGLYDDASACVMAPIACDFTATCAHRFAVDTAEDYRRLSKAAQCVDNLHASPDQIAALLDEQEANAR